MGNYPVNLAHYSREELERVISHQIHHSQFSKLSEVHIPLSIFSTRIPPLAALARYLNEERKLSPSEIADRLGRKPSTISSALNRGRKQLPLSFPGHAEFYIPLIKLRKTRQSIMETVILHLDSSGLSLTDMARMLGRSIKTIHTWKSRARNKSSPTLGW
ncbi:MAG: hypothetical protein ABIH34_03160 [Nanoarchaeota archaeon]